MFGLARLIVLVIVLIALYWAYYIFAAPNPDDRLGVQINSRLPVSMRSYGCEQLRQRLGDNARPVGCGGAAEPAPPSDQ